MTSLPLSTLLGHAARLVQGVLGGRSLTELLAKVPAEARPGAQALAFEALRRLGGAQVALAALATRAPAADVSALLLTALALLGPREAQAARGAAYAPHTLVDQTVHAVRQCAPAAAGFANAVLRRFLREREAIDARVQATPAGRYNHPAWWIERVRADWPAQWQGLLDAANRHPPMTLRVNARRTTAAAYVERLAAHGIAAQALGAQAVVLAEPLPVEALPGFAQGDVSVQDLAAQLAAPLLVGGAPLPTLAAAGPPWPTQAPGARLSAGARVLDACAAPGGKTAHLLELADLDLLALDVDALRLARVREGLDRLGLQATLLAADAQRPQDWWDGRPFDAILLDAPCSASGIVRRHPDIRWLRRPADIAALARLQAALLDALWPLLAPGGRVLYATCSLFKAEGQAQIDAFLQRHGPEAPHLDTALPGHLLPLPDNEPAAATGPSPDGFFYALLRREPPR